MADTIYQYFAETAARVPEHPALKLKLHGVYRDITFAALNRAVDEVAAGLTGRGVKAGSRVGIYSYNRPEWVIADLAIIKLGAVVVPVYHTLPPDSVRYILNDAAISHLVVESGKLLTSVTGIMDDCPALRDIITLFDGPPENRTGKEMLTFSSLQESGTRALAADPNAAPVYPAQADDLVTVAYTSGTTGEPKGAMLSHANILSNVRAAIARFNITERDSMVSFLPLCHMFERTCGYYSMLLAGASIAYAESLQTVAQDVKMVRPTLLIVVPRVLEKVYNTVAERILAGPRLNRALMVATLRTYTRTARLRARRQPIPLLLALQRWLLGVLVVRKLKALGGGRIRLLVSGSAPLEKRLATIIRALEFNLLEGYGLTETSPVVCAAVPNHERVGTVGKPFPGVEVRIGPDDEVLIRGPNVMKGYLNKPEETAKVIDADGWFHSGDQGRFDHDGNLIITGRIKEIIVNSYGKNVAPVPIEQALASTKYIEQAVVIGDRRPYLTALVVPGRIAIEDWAREQKLRYSDYPNLLLLPPVRALIRAEIENALARFAPYEQVRKFELLPEPFTVENGLLTPTLKTRRPKVAQCYRDLIDRLYRES